MIWVSLRAFDEAGAHDLRKERFIVVRNPRGIGRDVATGYAAPGAVEDEASAEVHAGQRLAMRVVRRVAIRAAGDRSRDTCRAFREWKGLARARANRSAAAQCGSDISPGKSAASAGAAC